MPAYPQNPDSSYDRMMNNDPIKAKNIIKVVNVFG